MGRKSKSLNEYQSFAKQHNLEFLETAPPQYTRDSVRWRCLHCQREMVKSMASIQRHHACFCRSRTLKIKHYHALARKHNIRWLGTTIPQNIQQKTHWGLPGQIFEASYADLSRNMRWTLNKIASIVANEQ